MVRSIAIHAGESFNFCSTPIPLAIGLFISATLLVALCAKNARKHKTENVSKFATKTPLSPLHKAAWTPRRKSGGDDKFDDGKHKEGFGIGEEGLWQKAILMGEKCQPPEFSGVIYYDYSGNRISELPKSPRAAPMSPLRKFSCPVEEEINVKSMS